MTWWLVKTAGTGGEGEGATATAAKALQTGQRLPGQIKPHTGTLQHANLLFPQHTCKRRLGSAISDPNPDRTFKLRYVQKISVVDPEGFFGSVFYFSVYFGSYMIFL
jgi:hypothetical protein